MAVCEQEVQDVKDENFELSKRNVMLVAEVERLRARPAPLPNKEVSRPLPPPPACTPTAGPRVVGSHESSARAQDD